MEGLLPEEVGWEWRGRGLDEEGDALCPLPPSRPDSPPLLPSRSFPRCRGVSLGVPGGPVRTQLWTPSEHCPDRTGWEVPMGWGRPASAARAGTEGAQGHAWSLAGSLPRLGAGAGGCAGSCPRFFLDSGGSESEGGGERLRVSIH